MTTTFGGCQQPVDFRVTQKISCAFMGISGPVLRVTVLLFAGWAAYPEPLIFLDLQGQAFSHFVKSVTPPFCRN